MLRDVLEDLGYECSMSHGKRLVISAPPGNAAPLDRIEELLKAWEDISLTLTAADLVLSKNPEVDMLLEGRDLQGLKGFARELRRDPVVLLSIVESQRDVPAPILEAMHRLVADGNKDELKACMKAYLEEE